MDVFFAILFLPTYLVLKYAKYAQTCHNDNC